MNAKPHIRLHVSRWIEGQFFAVVFEAPIKQKIVGASGTLPLPYLYKSLASKHSLFQRIINK